jgi:serine/threonine-protein kinase
MEGTMLIRDRYQIMDVLGRGSFGTVYLAKDWHSPSSAQVAIKCDYTESQVLRHETTMLNYLHQRVSKRRREGLAVPKVLWYGVVETTPMLVIPYYSGGSLTRWVRKHAPLPYETIHQKTQQILNVLREIHALFVIHRDLKPDNILLNAQEEPVIADFGLATFYVDGLTGKHLPKSAEPAKTVVGSLLYASVFSHLGIRNSRRDDCLQVGYIALYMALGGQLPWEHVNDESPVVPGEDDPFHVQRNRALYLTKRNVRCDFPGWNRYMQGCMDLAYDAVPSYVFPAEDAEDVSCSH